MIESSEDSTVMIAVYCCRFSDYDCFAFKQCFPYCIHLHSLSFSIYCRVPPGSGARCRPRPVVVSYSYSSQFQIGGKNLTYFRGDGLGDFLDAIFSVHVEASGLGELGEAGAAEAPAVVGDGGGDEFAARCGLGAAQLAAQATDGLGDRGGMIGYSVALAVVIHMEAEEAALPHPAAVVEGVAGMGGAGCVQAQVHVCAVISGDQAEFREDAAAPVAAGVVCDAGERRGELAHVGYSLPSGREQLRPV